MNLNVLIKQKINEYLELIQKFGYVKDVNVLNDMKNRLNSLKIERIYNAPGDAQVYKDKLMICVENIQRNMAEKGDYYLDEVLFHEFSHICNSLHKSIYGESSFMIREYMESHMGCFTTIELLEQDDYLLYNQDPYLGIILLDEVISQTIAQNLVLLKYSKMDIIEKKRYFHDRKLKEYSKRNFTTNICVPPLKIKTSLASYPEYDIFATKIINKYGYRKEKFIKDSLNKNLVKDLINNCKDVEELYRDLCYLGIIKERVYTLNGFTKITDEKDPANNPRDVYKTMQKILKNS